VFLFQQIVMKIYPMVMFYTYKTSPKNFDNGKMICYDFVFLYILMF